MNIIILASASSDHWLISLIAFFFAGLLFLMLGHYVGWIFLRRWREQAEKLESNNKQLAQKIARRQRECIEANNATAINS